MSQQSPLNNFSLEMLETSYEDVSNTRINKPKEIRSFNPYEHIRHNILNSVLNCRHKITENSYYCFTCKRNVCMTCGVMEHNNHLLIQRENCLNYDKTFFNEISEIINEADDIQRLKDDLKNKICVSIQSLKNKIDSIKEVKLKEVDIIFGKIAFNIKEMKDNFLKTKKAIEQFYSENEKFFNIKLVNNNNNNENDQNLYNTPMFNDNLATPQKPKKCTSNINATPIDISNPRLISHLNKEFNKDLTTLNLDLENTIFLMNFDIMNTCDNKNLEILDTITEYKNKISYINRIIEKYTVDTNMVLDKFLSAPIKLPQNIDYYDEIVYKIIKYNEHISKFKRTISEILKKNGNDDKIKDLISVFEDKMKNGGRSFFAQDYFMNPEKYRKSRSKKRKSRSGSKYKLRSTSKKKNKIKDKISPHNSTNIISQNLKRTFTPRNKLQASNSLSLDMLNGSKTMQSMCTKHSDRSMKTFGTNATSNSKIYVCTLKKKNPFEEGNISLNTRNIQKFFAYSVLDLIRKEQNLNIYSINNINKSCNSAFTKGNYSIGSASTLISITSRNSNQSFKKSDGPVLENQTTINYLPNYSARINSMKEKCKPIIGTNTIQYFNNKKINKINVKLCKEISGYTVFPEGCRHIFINDTLFITGGKESKKQSSSTVISYNINTKYLSKLPNMLHPHSYHTIEYIEPLDSLIVVGGENTKFVECYDFTKKKWNDLPTLSSSRADTNVYFNSNKQELFVLFGNEGEVINSKFSDVIEVLDLNDVKNGFEKVDYYKSSGLNLRGNKCVTMPLTKDLLIVYGGNNARKENKMLSVFNMSKYECINIDNKTLEQIKSEEEQMYAVESAINKI